MRDDWRLHYEFLETLRAWVMDKEDLTDSKRRIFLDADMLRVGDIARLYLAQ